MYVRHFSVYDSILLDGQLPFSIQKLWQKIIYFKALAKVYLSDVLSFAFMYIVILLYFRKKNLEEANISEEESQLDKVNKIRTR